MMLDTRSLKFDLLPLPDDVRVVIANSMVKHAVATGEYGNRRDEVEAGQQVLQRERGIELLRDATVADLEACREKMSAESFARCRHILTENGRVLKAREALLAGDMKRFGELMVEAHASFRDDFAASCAGGRSAGRVRPVPAGLQRGEDHRRRVRRLHGECGERIEDRGVCCRAAAGVRAGYGNRRGLLRLRASGRCSGAGAGRRYGLNPLAQQNPHRRFNPLKREWVLVSPHRTQRPWQGQVEKPVQPAALAYDPDCYLCPGNLRAGGLRTDNYTSTYVFENDFAALKPDAPRFLDDEDGKGLLIAEGESGVCRVLCFSPRHDLTLAKMEVADIRKVVDLWDAQTQELGARDDIQYVQVFENRGAMMGASNPHPHGQVWASRSIPNEAVLEQAAQAAYLQEHGCCLLCAYREMEMARGERICGDECELCCAGSFLGGVAL